MNDVGIDESTSSLPLPDGFISANFSYNSLNSTFYRYTGSMLGWQFLVKHIPYFCFASFYNSLIYFFSSTWIRSFDSMLLILKNLPFLLFTEECLYRPEDPRLCSHLL